MTKPAPPAEPGLEASRATIVRLVPDAMEHTVESYRAFVAAPVPLDAKEFKDHHTAGRTALAHLEALLRLARWAEALAGEEEAEALAGEEEAGEGHEDSLLAEARQGLTTIEEDAP